ncbi:MAG: hypothetical protein IT365_26760 [Candidatus Hydrogenedentes bacterium]|nr:hypothetical protein [Candidatus Hydrogenedentota bacterium]
MVVAMIAMGMVQMPFHEIVDVIPVRDRLVATAGAVDVNRVMRGAGVALRALVGIGGVDGKPVLIEVIAMRVQQVAVLQVVGVPGMLDSHMPASFVVAVDVTVVFIAAHAILPLSHHHLKQTARADCSPP